MIVPAIVWSQSNDENQESVSAAYGVGKWQGTNSLVRISQIGDHNTSNLDQFGAHAAHITQSGVNHLANIVLKGDYNTLQSQQLGNSNTFLLDLNGLFNRLSVTQDGTNNYLRKDYGNVRNLDMTITQKGGSNRLTIDLSGYVNGAVLPSSIRQENGGNISIKALDEFSTAFQQEN